MRKIESDKVIRIRNCGVNHCTKITFNNGYEVHSQFDLSLHRDVPSLKETRYVVTREGVMDEPQPGMMIGLHALDADQEPVPVTFNFDIYEGYIKGKATNFRRDVFGDEAEISFDIEWANNDLLRKAEKMKAGTMFTVSVVKDDSARIIEKGIIKEVSFY